MFQTIYALGLLHLFSPNPTNGEAFERHRLDNWSYVIGVDRFTQTKRCILRGPGVTYSRGAAIFAFGSHVDTSNAWYKVDSGPAKPWRTLDLELAKSGALSTGDDLSNPSKGQVAIPLKALGHGELVEIRPTYQSRAKRFDLRDLWSTLAAAKEDGCDPDRSY